MVRQQHQHSPTLRWLVVKQFPQKNPHWLTTAWHRCFGMLQLRPIWSLLLFLTCNDSRVSWIPIAYELNIDHSYPKNPPTGYMQAAMNIYANLNSILNNIKNGYYNNEHAFLGVRDGHCRFRQIFWASRYFFAGQLRLYPWVEMEKRYQKLKQRVSSL